MSCEKTMGRLSYYCNDCAEIRRLGINQKAIAQRLDRKEARKNAPPLSFEGSKACKQCNSVFPMSGFPINKRSDYPDRFSHFCIACETIKKEIYKKKTNARKRELVAQYSDDRRQKLAAYQREWRRIHPDYKGKWKKRNKSYNKQYWEKRKRGNLDIKREKEIVFNTALEFMESDLVKADVKAYHESEDFRNDPVPYRQTERFRTLAEQFVEQWSKNH